RGERHGERQERRDDIVVAELVPELERRHAFALDGQEEADGAAGEFAVGHGDPGDLADGDGGDREVVTREAEARVADGEREGGGERGTGEQAYPGRHSGVLEEQRRGVGARAEEGGLPEGNLSG